MFKLVTEKIDFILSILSAISKINEQVTFNINQETVSYRGMDTAHISLIDFEMKKDDFVDYHVEGDNVKVCFLLDKALRFIKKAKKGQKIELILERNVEKIKFKIISGHAREFVTPLMDDATENTLKLPKVEYKCSIRMTTESFKEALEDIKLVSDKVKLISLKEKLILKGETYEGVETSTTFSKDDVDILEINVEDEAAAVYNVEMMSNVVNEISKVSEILSVNFGTNLPVKIDFEFPEKQLFNFYLAPRVED